MVPKDEDPMLDRGRPVAASHGRLRLSRRVKLGWAIVGVVAVLVAGWSVLQPPSLNHTREPSNRAECVSNLHQIGLAILLYTQDFGGRYPDTLDDLLRTEQITPEAFVCPSSNDTAAPPPATGPTRLTPGHCSYVYVGRGLTDKTVLPTTVVAYEPLSDHDGSGCNVLFGDGHVEFVDAKHAAALPTTSPPATGPATR